MGSFLEHFSLTGSVVSDSLWSHGLQHTKLPYPSLSLEVCSNSCPLNQWCHPTISSSVIPFSSRFQSFPASGSFQTSKLFTSGGQSIGVSASTSLPPMTWTTELKVSCRIRTKWTKWWKTWGIQQRISNFVKGFQKFSNQTKYGEWKW